MTPEATVAEAGRKIGDLGALFYFVPATLARGKELGLDGLRFDVDATFGGQGWSGRRVKRAAAAWYCEPDLCGHFAVPPIGPRPGAS